MRAILGSLFKDVPRYLFRLLHNGNQEYLAICNRKEHLEMAPDGDGYRCDWQWTSDLYLPKVLPVFGRWLFRRAFKDFPVELCSDCLRPNNDHSDISFIIGHRGGGRLPQLLATLKSIAGQRGCRFECIVVEQDTEQVVRPHLPDWVRYIHTPLPDADMAYSRAWAFNVAAKEAQADFLIFHDNDLVIPAVYGKELYKYYCRGFEVVNLKRFIFYLDQRSSEYVCRKSTLQLSPKIDSIMQNAEGGGSIGIARNAFFEIGGFDERFIGWGGEDNEFWERALTRKVYPYGYLPLVHLWHQTSTGRGGQTDGNSLYWALSRQPVEKRINRLKKCIQQQSITR
ncbi:MAG: hypothetical protein DSY58_06750 [Desulfobulbus sp.]|nr:MAG: hypothetical protein DSY58_06750 [Desulfobulbus sp.]